MNSCSLARKKNRKWFLISDARWIWRNQHFLRTADSCKQWWNPPKVIWWQKKQVFISLTEFDYRCRLPTSAIPMQCARLHREFSMAYCVEEEKKINVIMAFVWTWICRYYGACARFEHQEWCQYWHEKYD